MPFPSCIRLTDSIQRVTQDIYFVISPLHHHHVSDKMAQFKIWAKYYDNTYYYYVKNWKI